MKLLLIVQFETWEGLKAKLAPGGRVCCNVGGFASAERAINAMRAAFGSGNPRCCGLMSVVLNICCAKMLGVCVQRRPSLLVCP